MQNTAKGGAEVRMFEYARAWVRKLLAHRQSLVSSVLGGAR